MFASACRQAHFYRVPLAFHAAPPSGHWLNDPNALIATGTGFALLAQHRADAPDFRETGWGLLTSPDLLDWRWEGVAVAPRPAGWAYSGCAVVAGGRPELFHTVHDPLAGLQHQVRLGAGDGTFRSWRPLPTASLPPPTRNLRDPFVFRHEAGWRMLLARPCDWTDWPGEEPSYLTVLASDDRVSWREAGRIGPWHPPGIMWEVPVLIEHAGRHLLLVSTIDRRRDGAACGVMLWSGRFDGATFHPDQPYGRRVDLGPDCYALMAGCGEGWRGEPPFVGWLASWATARQDIWPGFAGGPITLPRSLAVDRHGVPTNRPGIATAAFAAGPALPPTAGLGHARLDGSDAFRLELQTDRARLVIAGNPRAGHLAIARQAALPFAWSETHAGVLEPCAARDLHLFVDGPAVELFVAPEGRGVTVALPGRGLTVALGAAGAALPIEWRAYRGSAGAARRSALGVTP